MKAESDSSQNKSASAKGGTYAAAARCLAEIVLAGQSSEQAFAKLKLNESAARQCKAQTLQCLRLLLPLQRIALSLVDKRINEKDQILAYLLIVSINDLLYAHRPSHAVVDEAVAAARLLKRSSAASLVNATLRRAAEDSKALFEQIQTEKPENRFPGWLKKQLKRAYPEFYRTIAHESSKIAPIWLSISEQHSNRKVKHASLITQFKQSLTQTTLGLSPLPYLEAPFQEQAIQLVDKVEISSLPGFNRGSAFVQDRAAQLCREFLPIQAHDTILDACTAPGGKLMQLVSLARLKQLPIHIDAADLSNSRLDRTRTNLQRLDIKIVESAPAFHTQTVRLLQQDLTKRDSAAHSSSRYDRILLDAPCSATGVIRRHPDIPFVRKPADITELVSVQAQILDALWDDLKPGGHLLYATCSILPQENTAQIEAFVERHKQTAKVLALPDKFGGVAQAFGRQWLPGDDRLYSSTLPPPIPPAQNSPERSIMPATSPSLSEDSDGFYYCLLAKAS